MPNKYHFNIFNLNIKLHFLGVRKKKSRFGGLARKVSCMNDVTT